MFGPSSPRPPCSCAPSSVTQWLLYRTVLITVLFAVASSKDWRQDLQSDFTGHVQTIGPLDGRLWAITTEWTVHEMTPCDKGNETLSLCMEIGFPVKLDTKWPELAKSVKENAKVTDFNFAADNSVFMVSSKNDHVLILHGASFKPDEFFGFNFSAKTPVKNYVTAEIHLPKYLWISSDENNKATALDSGKSLKQIVLNPMSDYWIILVDSKKNICKVNHGDDLSVRITVDKCDHGEMDWTVLKAVRYGGQFYFFAKDKVYIFASVENVDTKVYTLSYDKFVHCKEPTTTKPPSTHPRITTSKGSNMTVIIVVVVGLVLLVIILIILAFVCCKKPSNSSQKSSASPGKKTKANNKVSSQKAGPSTKPESQAGSSKNFVIDSKANKKPQVSAAKGSSAASAQGKHSKSRAK